MSTPLERIEQYAGQLAVETALLVNKAHAAAIVAACMGRKCDEERFVEVCRLAYRSATETIENDRAAYLAKMLPPEPPAACVDCNGTGFAGDDLECSKCGGTGRSTPSGNPTGGPTK